MSRNPLFQVMFALQNVPEAQLAIDGLQIIPVEMDTSSAKFDLHLEITERQESLEALFNYNTDLFNESTIIRMAGHFQRLLEGIVSSPDKCLADLPLLPDVERNQLLEWNATEAVYPQNYCLHQLFEAQVEKSPDAIAVVFEDQQLTYEQLNAKANQLAYYLRTRGIGPEVLVGICVERSLEMVIGILAILKAGGAYVPIDPSYPRERIAFMLEDAQPVVSLIHTATREILPENISAVDMDEQWQAIAQFSEDKPSNLSQVQNLAYVIYTSGSTGKPKGALATHLNVLRLFSNTQSEFAFSNKDVWTLFHSSAFDFSVWELWGALIFGGKLVVVPYWVSRSPEEFYRLLCEQAVTVLNQTPSAFRSLIHKAVLAHDDGKQRHALRLVIFGGEALELRSLKPWFEHFGYDQPQLVNMYGITETTVHVTRCPIYQDTFQKISGSPIGQPVEDLQTYVLDRHLNLQPIGVPSELYIGGAGLVRGYLSRPGLTAERFVPNPFSKQPGGRLYRTGDLARYRADGNIEYLGRTDHQVKIRGFRIELGEIEAALLQHEGVEEAVVLVREDSLEDRRLVAYIAGNESVPDIETIRTHLKVSLPDYMVPSAFVFLDHFPLTPNGKLDRTALPAPDIDHQLTREYVAPRNPTEAILAEIWAEVLGVEKVGIHDNFFELGGHSIRSIQIVSLAREKGLIFSIEQLYRSRTIHELSQIVEGFTQSNSVASALDPFEMITWEDQVKLPEDIENAYPLSSLQAGMIFHSQSDPNAYHIFDSITLHCVFNQHCLEEAISYILRQHPILRTTFDFKNFSEPLQLVHKQPVVYIKYIDLRHFDSTQQLNMLLEWEEVERVSYFEIDQLPLIRFRIHQLADDRFQFSITEHHAVLDGWSLVTMLNEIFLHYFALLEAKPWGQIAGFDNAMYRLLSYEKDALNSDRYKDYLTQYLSGFEVDYLPELITDTGQDQYDWHPGLKIVLPQKLTQKLRDLADLLAVPLKSVLLAAHIRVVSLLSGKTNVTSGLVCNTRPEELGSEYVLGVFLNTLPFYQKLKNGNWQEFITQIFDTECKLLRVRYYPLAAIQRMYGGKPLFDTLFNYVHYHVGKPLLASNKLEIIDWQDDAQPNFSLEVGFNLDTLSSDIQLRLRGNKLNPGQLERIQSYFMAVLTEIADKPTTHIATHSFLSSFERHQLLVDWNATEAVYSQHYCLHQLFEARVEQNPEDVAVVFKNQQLTYEQLNAKANQLAHYLRAQGVGPEVLVGICIERSLEMVIGILGILKAGGAYLPIDPGYPRERIAFVLEDAQPVLSLIHTATREVLPEDIFVVDMDAQRQAIAQCSEDNPFSLSQVQNLAYVIYTSGSTGRPKGAGLAHQGVVNRLQWMQQQYQLNASDRVLQKTPFGFDVSVWEFFWPLLTGARLVVAQPEVHKDAMRIAQMIQDHEITIVHFVPSMLSAFLDIADVTICRSLRYVICSGEALSTSLQQKFFEKLPAQLHNLYGPTEASIDVTMWACEPDSKESVVPIGSPIANTQIYLLDAYLNLVPIGVPGELYIGGVGLARGYQNCAALTAERFIPNSFSRQPGERLYRTGDDGTLSCGWEYRISGPH
ncbi:MAG: amino acid adenylation domain-containing protein [Burkholderiales bacterium]|nr:amino acid adenylation domain-containing protein [Burkholderiales bacterium]